VKRYVAEPGGELVRDAMAGADGWFICRVGFVEVTRALLLAAGRSAAGAFRSEWRAFGVVEVDQDLVEHASALAPNHRLRSLDALHLASVLLLPRDGLVAATWDQRLHAAAVAERLKLLPERLD
jgi:predicted nucleic acid-binding protein